MTTPSPLQRADFNAQQLMSNHPPELHDRNKRIIFDVACPTGCVHVGDITYIRWAAMPLPAHVPLADAVQRVTVIEDVYDYAPTYGMPDAVEWHVNFADPNLFISYGSGLFAQDEMQVAEHPVLGALRQALEARHWLPRTMEKGQPTPVLVKNAERRCRVAINANRAERRPWGLYGNAFMSASAEAVRRATMRLDPPTFTNLIAIAAPSGGTGPYRPRDVDLILTTAYTGFRAARLESGGAPVVVHTGFWGCGAFGGNRVLMSMLQVLAAEMAGIDRLVLHTVQVGGRVPFDTAMTKMRAELPVVALNTPLLVDRIASMGFRWGASDGN